MIITATKFKKPGPNFQTEACVSGEGEMVVESKQTCFHSHGFLSGATGFSGRRTPNGPFDIFVAHELFAVCNISGNYR